MISRPDLAIFDVTLMSPDATIFGERSSAARALNGAIYRLLGDLGTLLHDADKRFFTAGPLRHVTTGEPVGRVVAGGATVTTRITILQHSATTAMHQALSQAAFQNGWLNLDGRDFGITSVAIAPGPLPGTPSTTTYERLLRSAPPVDNLTLRFDSVVRFRSSKGSLRPPLTAAARVFEGYLHWWRTFSGLALPGVDRAALEHLIRLDAEIPGAHAPWPPLANGPTLAEFLGTSRYVIAGDESFQRGVACLALFAAYCGTGSEAAMGMGQTWPRLSNTPVSSPGSW